MGRSRTAYVYSNQLVKVDLFNASSTKNLLPFDGEVMYWPNFIKYDDAKFYFEYYQNTLAWKSDKIKIYGKTYITKRQVAWMGDADYGYSGNIHPKQSWDSQTFDLKLTLEKKLSTSFNGCLFNLYPSGNEGMGWHADDEKELGIHPIIASLSLGAIRKFRFKHREKKVVIDQILEPGSLLVMQGKTQTHWLHELPKTKKVFHPRINLTFRRVY